MKYIYINDISYLLKKHIKILLVLFLVPVITMLINIKGLEPAIEHINMCMGTDLINKLSDNDILVVLMFILNIFVYIFFIADIYVKDISYQLDNIFLRMKALSWIIRKNTVFVLLTILMKVIQYILIIIALLIYKKSDIFTLSILELIVKDLFYTISVQFLFITIYIISSLVRKNKVIPYLIFMVIMVVIPKNIYNLSYNNIIFLGLSLVIIFIILGIIFKKYNKKIIENI